MKKNTIGLVIHHYKDMFGTFSAMEKIRGAKDAAFKKDIDLLVHISREPDKFNYKDVLGIVFADLFENEKLVSEARNLNIPYVILEYYDQFSPHNCIGIDNKNAVIKAINKLVELGHTRIATISGKLAAKIGLDRLRGYEEGLMRNKIKIDNKFILKGDWTKQSGAMAFKKLLDCKIMPTAIFAAGDEMALGVMEEAKKHNIRIPDDISLIGFDDIPLASTELVSLTTVKQPLYEMGKLGVEYLVDIIKKKRKTPLKVLLKNTKIILRGSTRKI